MLLQKSKALSVIQGAIKTSTTIKRSSLHQIQIAAALNAKSSLW